MKQYDRVKVVKLRAGRFAGTEPQFKRHPQVGDVSTIVEVYEGAFEVESCEPGSPATVWLEAMFPDELRLV